MGYTLRFQIKTGAGEHCANLLQFTKELLHSKNQNICKQVPH